MTRLPVFFAGIITSQPPFTVAEWTRLSLLIHSIVSPTFTWISTGENTSFSTVTWIVSARAGTAAVASVSRTGIHRCRSVTMVRSLLQFRRNVLGVLLVALKQLQPGFQQTLQLGIARGRNKHRF